MRMKYIEHCRHRPGVLKLRGDLWIVKLARAPQESKHLIEQLDCRFHDTTSLRPPADLGVVPPKAQVYQLAALFRLPGRELELV